MTEPLKFLHAIDLTNRDSCMYIVESGSINSLVQLGFWTDLPIDFYHKSLEDYRDNADEIFNKVVSPRAQIMFLASLIRKSKEVKIGGNPKVLTEAAKEKLLRKSNLELEVEQARRDFMPSAPCRLTCLYFVEDNEDGRYNLQRMLPHFKKPYVLEVTVLQPAIADHQVDNRWYEAYAKEPVKEYLEKYWKGEPFGEPPSWEYLLEGSLEVINPVQKRHVELFGSWQSEE